jgi:hypothetical protein
VSTADAVVALALAAAIGATLTWIALTVRHWGKATTKSAPPQRDSGPVPVAGVPARRWHALPGNNRMELGATGFAITLHTEVTGPLYCLWTPEGRLVGTNAFDLPQCKAWGERLAAERDEFVCTERPQLPRFHH